ncbi:MAG: autotransporter-associated beta strand repeat-containing protein, partial [Candidatus Neptunochlamydia sp.]|nr:autotransporter-associated beta strand repeat-containing protein [Candidatus Neptunochlamydia sp.]
MRFYFITLFFTTILVNISYAVILVTNGNDSGPGSLREAIAKANTRPDVIQFSESLTVLLSGNPLVISNTYMIDGGENTITVSGGNVTLPFFVRSGTPTIRNLTIDRGKAKGGDGGPSVSGGGGGGGAGLGGGAFLGGGNPILENIIFSNCNAEGGGGGITSSDGFDRTGGGGGGGFGGKGGGAIQDGIGGSGGGGVFPSYPGQTNGNIESGALGGFGLDGVSRVGGAGGDGSPSASGKDGLPGLRFGGGGGGGESFSTRTRGGNGGFSGGGGGEGETNIPSTMDSGGGHGGFGGGGGGIADNSSGSVGLGGFGGGSGGDQSSTSLVGNYGGGGAGIGGALFVSQSSSATLSYTSSSAATSPFSGNSVTAGLSPHATDGQAIGPNIFLRGGGVLSFNIDDTLTLRLPSIIKTDPAEIASTINKLGLGTLVMDPISLDSDANDFKSTINLNEGTVLINANNNLGNPASTLVFNGGILRNSSSTFTMTCTTNLLGSGTFGVENGTTITQNGDISGKGSLKKIGKGTLILSGNNRYEGGTIIDEGILSISSDSHLGDPSESLVLSGGILEATSSFSSSRNIVLAGPGGVSVDSGA